MKKHYLLAALAAGLAIGSSAIEKAQAQSSEAGSPASAVPAQKNSDIKIERLEPQIQEIVGLFKQIRPAVLSGVAAPKWEDFDLLQRILTRIKEVKAEMHTAGIEQDSPVALSALKSQVENDAKISELVAATKTSKPGETYNASEYELKLRFQYYLNRINRELPREMRIPIQRLPFDQRRKSFLKDARNLVRNLETSFEARFPSTGFKTYEDFVTSLKASTDPAIQKAIATVENEQIELIVRRPESARFWVPKVGFHNQFVTGTSRGNFNPDYRLRVETSALGLHSVDEYKKLPFEVMPKYGTMRAASTSGLAFNRDSAYHYGPDVWIIKTSDVKDRLSFTPNDSFVLSVYLGPTGNTISRWDESFIPWKHNFLIIPFVQQSISNSNSFGWPQFSSFVPPTNKYSYGAAYWEIQIFGPLDIENVSAFEFERTPPSGEFLLELLKHGIKIRDGRQTPPVEWTPDPVEIERARAGQ